MIAMWLIDRLGGRCLLLIGFTGTALSLAVLAGTVEMGRPRLRCHRNRCLLIYIASFAISLGPIPHIMS